MTTLYLFDEDQTLIHAIPSKDMIQARQTLEKPDDGELPIDQFTAIYKLEAYKDYESIHYMAVKDLEEDNAFHMYYVTQPIVKGHTVTLEGIQLGYRELKYFINSDIRPNGTARHVIGRVLEGSEWSVGYVSETDNQLNSFYYQPVLESLKELANNYGLELVFKVEISGQQITDKWVEAYNRRGPRTMKRFTHGENALSIKATIDRSGLYTALIGRGRGEEIEDSDGFGRAIQFVDVEWSVANGDPVDKPLGQNYVELPEATDEFGVVMRDGSKAPAMGVFEDDQIEDPAELLQATYNELVQRSRPLVQYQSTVAKMGKAELGETVTVHRYDLDLHYETRIFKLVVDYLNPKRTEVELGDHVVESRQARESRTQRTIANLTRDQQRIREEVSYVVRTADGFNRTTYGNVEPEERRVGDYWVRDHPVHEEHTQSLIWTGDAWELLIDTSRDDEVSRRVTEALEEAQDAKAQVERESEERRADIQAESERLSTEWNERIEANEQIVEDVRHSTEELMNDFDRALTQANSTSIEDLTTTLNSRSLEAIENARESIEIAERADGHALEALDVVNGFGTRITDVESTVEGQVTSINTAIATAERVERDLTRVEDVAEGARVVANRVEETAEGFEQSITRIESDLDGKATVAAFNTLESTVDGSIQRIGDAEGNITQMEADIEGIMNTVSDYEGRISRTEQRADGLYDVVHDPNTGLLTEVGQIAEGYRILSEQSVQSLIRRNSDGLIDWDNVALGSAVGNMTTTEGGTRATFRVDENSNAGSGNVNRIWGLVNNQWETPGRYAVRIKIRGSHNNQRIAVGQSGSISDWVTITQEDRWYEFVFDTGNSYTFSIYFHNNNSSRRWYNIADLEVLPTAGVTNAQLAVLHNAIDLAVEEGDVIGRLNIQAGHTLIQNGEILMDADTVRFTGSAFIPNAAIEEVSANKIIGNDGQFNTLRSRFLTSNLIESDHLNVTTAMIDRLFANSALIERLTSQQAFIDQLSASNLEIDGGRVHGTLDGNSLNFVNIDVNSLSGNLSEFVRTQWNNSVGGSVNVDGSGLHSVQGGNEVHLERGVITSRTVGDVNPNDVHYGSIRGSDINLRNDYAGEVLSRAHINPSIIHLEATANRSVNVSAQGITTQIGDDTTHFGANGVRLSGGAFMSRFERTGLEFSTPSYIHMRAWGEPSFSMYSTSNASWKQLNMQGNRIFNIPRIHFASTGYIESTNTSLEIGNDTHQVILVSHGSDAFTFQRSQAVLARNLNMVGNNINAIGTLNYQSDERLKEDIIDTKRNSLDIITSLRYKEYYWKNKNQDNQRQFGLIAQEVNSQLRSYDSENDIYGINQNALIHTIGHGLQQLSKEHENTLLVASHAYLLAEQHEDEIACYKKKIEELEKKVERLEGAA